uniref:ABC transmembrane type-1 domain-containing protein n=1 Tax=Panagrolaimus sp. PS1159 TaxID=55785 RepID=A0AC35FGA3_9BILA
MSSRIQKIKEKVLGLFNFKEALFLLKFVSFSNWIILIFGGLLAICTGVGLPHLIGIVGWILNIYIFVNPQSTEYSATITPLLMYYCALALMLSIIAFFQYACFNYVAISVTRRIRRSYFRLILNQSSDFFHVHENQFATNTICADLQTLSIVIIDTLPGIIVAIVQLVTAGLMSYLLTWRLSWLISTIAVGCGIWIAILQKLIRLENIRETKLISQYNQSIDSQEKYQQLFKQQMNSGIRKGFLQGTLTGSLQFFPFIGWGAAAIYGNWLLDRDLMNLPAYIYVCVSTLIPACVRIGQLPQMLIPLNVLSKLGRMMKGVKKELQKAPLKDNDFNVNQNKKDFLIAFIKAEIGVLSEELSDYPSSPTFRHVCKNASSHWFFYIIGFLCCGMVGVSMCALTKLNGNMFEFYNKTNIRTFFNKGSRIALDYLIVGVTTFVCGIVAGGIFGFTSESAIKKLRNFIFNISKNQTKTGVFNTVSIAKHSNIVRWAFDNHLGSFLIAVLAIICAILSNVHKSLTFTFLTSVAFTLQVVAQIFVIRFAEICTENANEVSHSKGLELLLKLETIEHENVDSHLNEINKLHTSYLTFAFRKQYSTIFAKALRFSFVFAVPQVTQAISYAMGSYMVINKILTPVSVYKIVQTIYNAIGGVPIIAQYSHDVFTSKIAAQKIDENLELADIVISKNPEATNDLVSTSNS